MRNLRSFDQRVTGLVQGLPESLQPFMGVLSFLGEPMLVLTVGFGGFVAVARRGQSQLEHAFAYAAAAFALSTLLKLLLHRRRPHNLEIRTLGLRSYSFPSGHAFGTVIFYGLFSYLDLKYLSHPWNFWLSLILWLIIFLIGVSRIYLKAHYPTDVAGGWLLGLLSLAIVIWLAF
jgi:undecaprenyl-diphosphatase